MREKLIELILQIDKGNYILDCFKERPRKRQSAEILADYLIDNGVVVLPCKVGDVVYIIPKYKGKPYCGVKEDKIQMIGMTNRGWHVKTRDESNFNKTYILGKTAFLAKEEAEKALERSKAE